MRQRAENMLVMVFVAVVTLCSLTTAALIAAEVFRAIDAPIVLRLIVSVPVGVASWGAVHVVYTFAAAMVLFLFLPNGHK